jgi:hypothetical protein
MRAICANESKSRRKRDYSVEKLAISIRVAIKLFFEMSARISRWNYENKWINARFHRKVRKCRANRALSLRITLFSLFC